MVTEAGQGSKAAVADLLGGDGPPCAEGEWRPGHGLLALSGLEMLDDPGVEVRAPIPQAAAHLHGAWSEPDPAGPPGIQGRLRNGEVFGSLVDL